MKLIIIKKKSLTFIWDFGGKKKKRKKKHHEIQYTLINPYSFVPRLKLEQTNKPEVKFSGSLFGIEARGYRHWASV